MLFLLIFILLMKVSSTSEKHVEILDALVARARAISQILSLPKKCCICISRKCHRKFICKYKIAIIEGF